MTRSLTRRVLLTSAALGTAVLAACSSPTAPQNDTVPLEQERNGGGVYGGSSTKMCNGGGVYGGSSTC